MAIPLIKYYGIVTFVLTIRHVFVKAGMALLKGYTFPAKAYRCTIIIPCKSKRQTRRKAGTQSHGSSSMMRRYWKTARPPKLYLGGCLFKEVSLIENKIVFVSFST
jgi:hypothetical protein